jgi:hypothetical protein
VGQPSDCSSPSAPTRRPDGNGSPGLGLPFDECQYRNACSSEPVAPRSMAGHAHAAGLSWQPRLPLPASLLFAHEACMICVDDRSWVLDLGLQTQNHTNSHGTRQRIVTHLESSMDTLITNSCKGVKRFLCRPSVLSCFINN